MDPTAAASVVAAQSATVPLDLPALFTNGPLVGIIGLLVWWITRLDQQLLAERALNAALQEKRLEDQKVLIPLANSMVASTEQSHELVKRMVEK